jgi:F-type H+-transporting ATPase subunit epsilon
MAAARLTVSIISPESTVFEGEADMVVAPAWDGQVGILPNHAPMLVLLGEGPLRVEGAGGGPQQFTVSGGFMQVFENTVTVLSERASSR